MSTDKELLQELFNFMVKRSYVQGDEAGIMDMVQRYKQPPLTRYHQVCMQMTQADYRNLENLLERIVAHFAPVAAPGLKYTDDILDFPDGPYPDSGGGQAAIEEIADDH